MSSALRRVLSPALIWHIPGHSHVQDVSGYGNHGSWGASEAYTDGPFGRMMMSMGGGSGVIVSSASNMGLTGDVTATLAVWFRQTAFAQDGLLTIGNAASALEAMGLFLGVNGNGSISVEFSGGNGHRSAAGLYTAGAWHHFVATKSAGAINATTTLYLDGAQIASAASDADTPALVDDVALVGAFDSPNTNVLTGALGDARVYNIALEYDEVVALYRYSKLVA